jgi:glutathione S-transferase
MPAVLNPQQTRMAPALIKPMTLYSGPLSMYGAKAQIAALEKGLPVHVVMVPFTDDHRYEPKHPEVLRINPKRQVPVLVHGEVEIFDSTQIFEYFEDLQPSPPLWPLAHAARAVARLLELQSDEVFFPHVIRLMGSQERLNDPLAQEAVETLNRIYGTMDTLLEGREYLSGDYTYADIAFFMAQLFAARLGAPMGEGFSRLLRWRSRVARRPAVRPILRQIVTTLIRQCRPVPPFMQDALADPNA